MSIPLEASKQGILASNIKENMLKMSLIKCVEMSNTLILEEASGISHTGSGGWDNEEDIAAFLDNTHGGSGGWN